MRNFIWPSKYADGLSFTVSSNLRSYVSFQCIVCRELLQLVQLCTIPLPNLVVELIFVELALQLQPITNRAVLIRPFQGDSVEYRDLSVTTKTTPSFSIKHAYYTLLKKPQIFLSRFIEILATSFRNGAKMKLVFAAGTRQTRNNHLCKQTLKCPEAMILHLKSNHNSAVSVCSDSKEGLPFLIKLVQARLLYGLLLSKGTHVQSLQHSVPFCCS